MGRSILAISPAYLDTGGIVTVGRVIRGSGMAVIASIAIAAISLNIIGLRAIRGNHSISNESEQAINIAISNVTKTNGPPIIVWTHPLFPQVMWDGVDTSRTLIANEVTVSELLQRIKLHSPTAPVVVISHRKNKTTPLVQQYGYSTVVSSAGLLTVITALPPR